MTDTRPNWRQRGYDREYDRNRRRILRTQTTCHICGKPVDTTLSGRNPDGPSIDHIVPRSSGGTNSLDNLALAHLSCNSARFGRERPKRRRDPEPHPGLIA